MQNLLKVTTKDWLMSADLVRVGGNLTTHKGATENTQEYFPNLLECLLQILYSILVIQTYISKCE